MQLPISMPTCLINQHPTDQSDVPLPFRVRRRRQENADTFTRIEPAGVVSPFAFSPGQFNMLYVFGVGGVPIDLRPFRRPACDRPYDACRGTAHER
jgi:hypothetical protein